MLLKHACIVVSNIYCVVLKWQNKMIELISPWTVNGGHTVMCSVS